MDQTDNALHAAQGTVEAIIEAAESRNSDVIVASSPGLAGLVLRGTMDKLSVWRYADGEVASSSTAAATVGFDKKATTGRVRREHRDPV